MKKSFKWYKQQILFDFHIRDAESFQESITIFSHHEINGVIDFIAQQKSYATESKKLYFVIILVPINHEFKLRNIVVKENIDANCMFELLRREGAYSEIWVCKNWMSGRENFSGRFCMDQLNGIEDHILEIVNDDIPRSVEKIEYHCEKSSEKMINYYKYFRYRWCTRFRQSSDQYGNNEMNEVIIQICQEIERKREQIEFLYSCLKKIGIENLSLDFRFKNGSLEFIDWDTENDKCVIAHLGLNDFERYGLYLRCSQ